ncbi:MAG TPA: UDP-glucose 4-epimerase GalE [Chroococcales cyanobacterium]|jgi:UDP-glucose 4-epimerase
MKVLVAGGAGYIGSVAVEELLKAGHAVAVFDNLSKGHERAVHPEASFFRGDLGDSGRLEEALDGCEAVLHFAADSLVGESMRDPGKYFKNNIGNTLSLLEAMRKKEIRKIVFSSTAAVYGEPENLPIQEFDRQVPTNPYGESKKMIEGILRWYEKVFGFRFAVLRYFNAAGASGRCGEDHAPESHLIPLVLQVALGKRDSIEVFGEDYPTEDGTCVRDYIHVIDLAQAHVQALEALDKRSFTFNLGNGLGFSVKQVIEAARLITGHPIPVKQASRREGDPAVLVASSEAIKKELGWAPRHPGIDSIVESAWLWHLTHREGYGE